MGLEVALCELTYYHQWSNISAVLGNNQVSNGQCPGQQQRDPDRWIWSRDSCKKTSGVKQRAGQTPRVLSRDIRARQGVHGRRATQTNHPSGDLRASCRGQYVGEPLQRRPSTLLKSIPVENERCVCGCVCVCVCGWGGGGGRTETFPVLQYKRLASGPLSQLTLTILHTGGRNLGFDYLRAVLHIRRNG